MSTEQLRRISTFKRIFRICISAIWAGLAVAALSGMFYSLWWKRDRVLYLGKSTAEKRAAVLERAGLDPVAVTNAAAIGGAWPTHAKYSVSGDANNLSYIKYLIAPRIPDSDAALTLILDGRDVTVEPDLGFANEDVLKTEPAPSALILSMFMVLGLGLLCSALTSQVLSVPELFAGGALIVCLAALVSRAITTSISGGILFCSAIALIGYIRATCNLRRRWSVSSAWAKWVSIIRSPRPGRWASVCIVFLFAVIASSFVLCLMCSVVTVPDDWDAWAIWGVKAKVLALGTGPLADVTHFDHHDYPLLWPTIWAFAGRCAGGWEEQWSRGWGPVFMLLSAWELIAIAWRNRGSIAGAVIGSAILVSLPILPVVASWSYAEAPLWLMMLCCYRKVLDWRESGRLADAALAGVFAAGAAYTKNEGVLFALLAVIWMWSGTRRVRAVVTYVSVVALLYAPWAIWIRWVLRLGSHATGGLGASSDCVATALSRLMPALAEITNVWAAPTTWGAVLAGAFTFAMVIVVKGSSRERVDIIVPFCMLSGYFVIVVCHKLDVQWLVSTSWSRLTLQFLTVLLGVIAGSRTWRLFVEPTPGVRTS